MADIFELFKKISKPAEPSEPISYIIVGLGNPGDKYKRTRHNAGFMAIDYVAEKCGVSITRSKFKALVGEGKIAGRRVLLMKPQTFMNLSGEAIREAADFYKISPSNIIVLFDDVTLDVARLRVRRDGSAGGHNGIKSIIAELGSDKFPRIKIGVGQKPHPDFDLIDWVLGELSKSDIEKTAEHYCAIYEGLEKIVCGDIDAAMQICNAK